MIRLHRDQNDRIAWQQSSNAMQDQNRPHRVFLLQALRHGRDLMFAKAREVLQLKRLQRQAINRGGTHPTNEDRLSRSIPTPDGELVPWIKGFRTHLNTTTVHGSTTRERRKKRQLVPSLQQLVRTNQLLIDRNADPL